MPLPVPVDLPYLEKLAADVGTPYQLYDEASIRSNARGLLSAFRGAFGDTFSQFYAVKALPNPAILRVLIEEGCGLDCSSTAELHIAKILGVPGRQVMYTSNYTSKADLATAFDQGVVINLDDVSLVADLKAVRGRTPDLICFRLNPGLGRTDSETASNVLGGPDAKFGVPADQIVEAYRQARAAGSTRFGMHMMTGSCVLSDSYWEDTVAVLLRAVGQVQRELGITFEFINIGGGLGIPYRPEQPPVDIPALAARLRHVMTAAAARAGLAGLPRLCMENGRCVLWSAGT
jgi:diaminopimelate decarboxylase